MQYLDKSGGANPPAATKEEKVESPKPKREEKESTGCVFCDKANDGPEYDRENLLLLRGKRNFVILNLFPYNSAHLMVVPYEHTDDYTLLDEETTSEMTTLVRKMIKVIREEYRPEGFNLGMNMGRVAGAGIADHIHMHIVPRWGGDSNFMPIVGETKVMPEMLETTYDRLKARIKFGE